MFYEMVHSRWRERLLQKYEDRNMSGYGGQTTRGGVGFFERVGQL